MGDFFAFRTLITPRFIQILFVLGLLGLVLAFIGLVSSDEALAGIMLLVFGTLYWRIVCELFFVFFRISDTLVSIKADTTAIAPTVTGQEVTPPAAAAIDAGEPTVVTSSGPEAIAAGTEQIAAAAPEGWYDDSERPGHKRWWDGTAWGMKDDEHPSTERPPE